MSSQSAFPIRGVIDIGTNSVKILIAEVNGSHLNPLLEKSEQTRLGRGFYESHLLQPEAIAETVKVIATFASMANSFRADSLRIIATSAVRDAKNKTDLVEAIREAINLEVEVISGAQEAELAFSGVSSAPYLAGRRLLVTDVGGGSTEFILGEANQILMGQSFALGTVRLLENIQPIDPPSKSDFVRCFESVRGLFKEQINPYFAQIEGFRDMDPMLVGTGGTCTILARLKLKSKDFERNEIEGLQITRQEIEALNQELWSLPLAARKVLPGMPGKRADVILMGTVIFSVLMEELHLSTLTISTRGLRYAALLKAVPKATASI